MTPFLDITDPDCFISNLDELCFSFDPFIIPNHSYKINIAINLL